MHLIQIKTTEHNEADAARPKASAVHYTVLWYTAGDADGCQPLTGQRADSSDISVKLTACDRTSS